MLRGLLCLAALAAADAAVIGIDFGARYLKVGIIQPGKGVDLVLNEATKRKSSTAAGFNNQDERVYGDESFNLVGKIPHKQFIMAKLLLGKNISHPDVLSFKDHKFPYEFSEDKDTQAVLLQYNKDTVYNAEELVAFVLSYAKQISEAHAGTAIKDAVITIPPFFKHTERNAMLNAAAIAGLNVLSLMHDNTAWALKYGFDKEVEFSTTEPMNVVFVDMGSTAYVVSVASFLNSVGKKNKTTGSLTMHGVAWDEALGGRNFDRIAIDLVADGFAKINPKLSDVRTSPRAMGKLRKEGERVKEVLSANNQFQIGIEGLHEDHDLRMVMNREEFVARAESEGLWARLVPPMEAALAQANMTKSDIHRVEIVGGSTRIPKIKEAIKTFFDLPISASLNGDEAAALGATLYAAKLSTSFRLREFGMTDAYPHAIAVKLGADTDAADESAEEEEGKKGKGKDKALFKANGKFPHKKLITMSRTEDLMVSLSYGDPATRAEVEPISTFNISGVAGAIEKLTTEKRTPQGKPKVSVTFALNPSGLLEVSKSELALEMLEQYDDWESVPLNETELAEAEAKEAAAAAEAAAKATEGEEAEATEGENATANATQSNATKTKLVKVQKERKRMHYSVLKAGRTDLGATLPLSEAGVKAAVARNQALLAAEKLRKLNAEAKNEVESFIINTRDKMSSEESVEQVSLEEERAAISQEFSDAEDWLYEDGRDLDAKAYQKKKKELEARVAPILLRATELSDRPLTVTRALEAVNWTHSILQTWAAERPEVTEAERALVGEMCTNFSSWLEEVGAKQAALALTEPPAFLSSQVTAKLEPIEREVRRLIKKPKPKAPKVKKEKSNGTNSTTANTTADEPNATAAEEPAEAEGEEKKDEL